MTELSRIHNGSIHVQNNYIHQHVMLQMRTCDTVYSLQAYSESHYN